MGYVAPANIIDGIIFDDQVRIKIQIFCYLFQLTIWIQAGHATVKHAIASGKPDQNYIAIRDLLNFWQLRIGTQLLYRKLWLVKNLQPDFAFYTAAAVVFIMNPLKIYALPSQLSVTYKPLLTEKLSVVLSLKLSITPFRHGSETGMNTGWTPKCKQSRITRLCDRG